MRTLGQNPMESELQELMAEVDKNHDGNLDFPEFLSLMARVLKGPTLALLSS